MDARVTLAFANAYTLIPICEASARDNMLWYLDQWSRGKDPKCCVKCAGCRWSPDRKHTSHRFYRAQEILKTPRFGWSCKELAAVDCGVKRAREVAAGVPIDVAEQYYQVSLQDLGNGDYHAVVLMPDGSTHDPTRGLER